MSRPRLVKINPPKEKINEEDLPTPVGQAVQHTRKAVTSGVQTVGSLFAPIGFVYDLVTAGRKEIWRKSMQFRKSYPDVLVSLSGLSAAILSLRRGPVVVCKNTFIALAITTPIAFPQIILPAVLECSLDNLDEETRRKVLNPRYNRGPSDKCFSSSSSSRLKYPQTIRSDRPEDG